MQSAVPFSNISSHIANGGFLFQASCLVSTWSTQSNGSMLVFFLNCDCNFMN